MDNTSHIFSEYTQPVSSLTPEQKHVKRVVMEQRVYTILKSIYLEKLKEFWSTYTVPGTSVNNRSIVIIEPSIHPNLEFVLYSAAYFARGWSITIICSDMNHDYIKGLLGPTHNEVCIMQEFKGTPEPRVGKNYYNYLLQSLEFYEKLPCENLLFMEMDTYLRKPLPDSILEYDYIAAPYSWDNSTQGGGLSFRKKSVMIRVCTAHTGILPAQDVYADSSMKLLGFKTAPYEIARKLFCESCLYEDPVGFHQWWTFFHLGGDDYEKIYRDYMTLEM